MNALPLLMQVTVFSAILYLALLLLRRLFAGRISASLQYGLWFLLILRLMIPVTIDSRIRLITLPAQAAQVMIPARAVQAISPAGWMAWNWDRILTAVWIAGMAVSFVWLLFVYVRLSVRISQRGKLPDEAARAVFVRVKADLGIRRGPALLCMANISTPALTVGLQPKLLLPAGFCMSQEELENVLRHELTHYRRGDAAVCLALSALRCVWWFNPVVWLAARQIRLDMEISCDNLAVRHMSAEGRKRYASMILAMFGTAKKPGLVMGFSPEHNRTNVEKRIRGVFMNAKSVKSSLVAAAIAAALFSAACFTTACVPTVAKSTPPPAVTATATPSLVPTTSPVKTSAPIASSTAAYSDFIEVMDQNGIAWNVSKIGNEYTITDPTSGNTYTLTYNFEGDPPVIQVCPQDDGNFETGISDNPSVETHTKNYYYTTTSDGQTVLVVTDRATH